MALKRIVLKKGQGVAGWIAAELRGVIIDDCRRDPRHAAAADRADLVADRRERYLPRVNAALDSLASLQTSVCSALPQQP